MIRGKENLIEWVKSPSVTVEQIQLFILFKC